MSKKKAKSEEETKAPHPKKHPGILTNRETDLMRVVARGATPQRAALEMDLTVGTVNTYLKRIYPKLGATTMREAAVAFHSFHALADEEDEALAQELFARARFSRRDNTLRDNTLRDIAMRVLGLVEARLYSERREELDDAIRMTQSFTRSGESLDARQT